MNLIRDYGTREISKSVILLAILMVSIPLSLSFSVDILNSGDPIAEGEDLAVNIELNNTGNSQETQTVEMDVEGVVVASDEITLESGETTQTGLTWNTEVGDAGERDISVSSESSSDSKTVTIEETSTTFDVEILSYPSNVEVGDNVYIGYSVENTGDYSATKDVSLDLGDLGSDSESVNLDSGQSVDKGFSVKTSEGDEGDYTADLSTDDDADTKSFSVVQKEEDYDNTYNQVVESPSDSYVHDEGDSLVVEWVSENNWSESRTLEDSEVIVLDQEGGEYSESVSRSETVSSGDIVSESLTISSSDLESNLEYSGEWSVQIVDNWEDESLDSYVYFDTYTGFSDGGGDNTTDDDTSDDGSDVIVDDGSDDDNSTDDSTDDSTEDNAGDDSTDDSTEGDSTDDSTDCPDGFSYDEGNDVCLEDSGDDSDSGSSDGISSDGSSNEGDSGDDNVDDGSDDSSADGGSSTELDDSESTGAASILGNEVSGVPLWIPGLILLVTGILFWRSDYELDF